LVSAALLAANRAVYSVRPAADNVIALAADKPWWLYLHVIAAVLLTATMFVRRGQPWAGVVSVCVMGTWSLLLLAWGLSTASRVSLLGPSLGLVIATVAIGTTVAWTDRTARPAGR
jgi:hypothetical protein